MRRAQHLLGAVWARLANNFTLKLLSLGLAVVLWVVVLGEQKAEVVLNVPLDVGQIPRNLMVINDPVEFVALKVRGPRSLVLALAPNEVTLGGNFARAVKEGDNYLNLSPEQFQVPRGVEVLSVSPGRVRLVLEPVDERRLEVIPKFRGDLAKGFSLGEIRVNPKEVRVVGPQGELKRLSHAFTRPIDIKGRDRDFRETAAIEPFGRRIRIVEGETVRVEVGIRKGST
ncbi:MAG: YbbR-like domain-containing protein [candidate division NC10 bacterium]|nr:YbbR-like domain-containing protein [candidate division NC10 bacterium]